MTSETAADRAALRERILQRVRDEHVRFINLQFTDVVGLVKSVTIPAHQFEDAIDHGKWFDGSSIEGFARVAESDMYLDPDLTTFALIPWERGADTTGKVICDVYTPEGEPFPGDPRHVLRRAVREAERLGFRFNTGPELEFFLLRLNTDGTVSLTPHDEGGYFDLSTDLASQVRKEMVNALEALGITVETSHHEVATGQHEIDFQYDDALRTADNAVTFRYALKAVARRFGLHATFMPKPFANLTGSGCHAHVSVWREGRNLFEDPEDELGISATCRHFMGGVLRHAEGLAALTNPTVNSYKRINGAVTLSGATWAPGSITWAGNNRTHMVRIPDAGRFEIRLADGAVNPYLLQAGLLAAGLAGLAGSADPGPPLDINMYTHGGSVQARRLPANLLDALRAFEADETLRSTLGESFATAYLRLKHQDWAAYARHLSSWELETTLDA